MHTQLCNILLQLELEQRQKPLDILMQVRVDRTCKQEEALDSWIESWVYRIQHIHASNSNEASIRHA